MQAKIYNITFTRDSRRAGGDKLLMEGGVTLVEMLIVIGIISLLVSIVMTAARSIQAQDNKELTEGTIGLLEGSLQEYYDFTGAFPVQPELDFANAAAHSEILYSELHRIPSSRQMLEKVGYSLIKNEVDTPAVTPPALEIYDAWGTVLDYTYVPGEAFAKLRSAGADKEFDTADDIENR